MSEYTYITLRQSPQLKEQAALWFHNKWEVPQEAYLECMEAYLNNETEYGWYLCLDGDRIAGGLGVIENDFHNRKDLTPNVKASACSSVIFIKFFFGMKHRRIP